jgi:large subunit ribosomal protein L25
MERIELKSATRTIHGKQVKRLRAESQIPAVVYGPDMSSQPIQIDERGLVRVLREAGATALIDLYIDDGSEPHVVLAREIQRDSLTGRALHVDFYEVRLTETVRTMPRLEFVGKSPAAEAGLGVLIHGMTSVEVECLPTELISSIEVDVSVLETLEDVITVSDLPVPDSVTVIADPGEMVASVVPTRMEVMEEEEVEEEFELEEGEVVEVEVAEEEEVAEED